MRQVGQQIWPRSSSVHSRVCVSKGLRGDEAPQSSRAVPRRPAQYARGRSGPCASADHEVVVGVFRDLPPQITVVPEGDHRVEGIAWRPDGRAIVAAADFNDGPFNLYEIAVHASSTAWRRLTTTTGGATWPDMSPDGKTIAFVGYTPDGFDLFVMAYPEGQLSTDFRPEVAVQSGQQGDLPSVPPVPPVVESLIDGRRTPDG